MTTPLQAVHLHGINTDSLGQYLMALGVLSAASQKWPDIRGCWRDGHFVVLEESLTIDHIVTFLGTDWRPTQYRRWWSKAQKSKAPLQVWLARNEQKVSEAHILDAQIVCTSRIVFNPLIGAGGVWGRRDWAKTAQDALTHIREHPRESVGWAKGALAGEPVDGLPAFSGAGSTWFVYANKAFNSGQSWFRKGKLSPWCFLLALEGALLLTGGVNKRLGTRARPYAVFPFVSEPASPELPGEVGTSKGEFWAPLWVWPATIVEVRCLFQRGLARLGGNPAKAPHEFAVAALAAGVDAGVTEFARYELRQTTSSQVYEAIPREHVRVPEAGAQIATSDVGARRLASDLLMELIESRWLDRLPFEPRDAKQRGKFVGLCGPVESAIIRVSEEPDDADRWQQLLLRLAEAQFRIDRNKKLRERGSPLPLLSYSWLEHAWPQYSRPEEIEMAAAIASVTAEPWQEALRQRKTVAVFPVLVNVFGVEVQARLMRNKKTYFAVSFPAARPQRAVWHSGDPLQVLIDVAHRRLVDAAESDAMLAEGAYRCPARIIDRLLSADPSFDLELVAKWLAPLTLINWSQPAPSLRRRQRSMPQIQAEGSQVSPGDRVSCAADAPDGVALLDALFRPLFQPAKVWVGTGDDRRLLFDAEKDQLPPPAVSRRLFNLMRQGALDDAVHLARSRYLAVHCKTVGLPLTPDVDPRRIAAALLVPMRVGDLQSRFNRWVQPPKNVPSRRTA